jgi:hypothetical protein
MLKLFEEFLIILLSILSPIYQFIFIYIRFYEQILNQNTIILVIITNIITLLYSIYLISFQMTNTIDFIILDNYTYLCINSFYIIITLIITLILIGMSFFNSQPKKIN